MSGLLSKAARGFSGAAVGLADDALAELRNRRIQEFQYNLGAGDRAQARQDNLNQQDRQYDLAKTGQDHQIANSDKSLELQTENVRADNQSRNEQLGIARDGLKLQQDNSEYSRVESAYVGAMAGVANISQRMAEVEKMQPKINAQGDPIEDPKTFQDRKAQMLADLEDKLDAEKVRAKAQVDQIHEQFPQYKKYFVQGKKQEAEPAIQAPPLLRRPTPDMRYNAETKLF